MWERSINLWLRPPPWGESCHSQYRIALCSFQQSFLLLIDWGAALQCFSISAAVAFASSAETIYQLFGRLLQTLQDGWKAAWNKSNLGSWSNIQRASANWNTLCSYNIVCSKKSNLLLLPSPCWTTITRISSEQDSGESPEQQPVHNFNISPPNCK